MRGRRCRCKTGLLLVFGVVLSHPFRGETAERMGHGAWSGRELSKALADSYARQLGSVYAVGAKLHSQPEPSFTGLPMRISSSIFR